MITETPSPRSRRALLTAALGAGVATIAAALGRPLPAQAADGETVLVGGEYLASSVTKFDTEGTGAFALWGSSDLGVGVQGSSDSGYGVNGYSTSGRAVRGISDSGYGVNGYSTSSIGVLGAGVSSTGVHGQSTTGRGVLGYSVSYIGVYGTSQAADEPAILGVSEGANTGVQGYSGASPTVPAAPAKTGVYGYAAQDANAVGVKGQTTTGRGVNGVATTGTGGYFSASLLTGTALRAVGRVKLDKCAGLATILSGTKSVVVTPGIDLVTTSAVVATLQGSAGGTTTVHRCVVNATTNAFTIYLTANSTANVKVAWHVFG